MNLEQQVCSLDLAKRLKELGVKQEPLFFWVVDDASEVYTHKVIPTPPFMSQRNRHDNCAAFTVAELGEMLPAGALGAWLMTSKNVLTGSWNCAYGVQKTIFDETEADARAKMLIYLLENKLITV